MIVFENPNEIDVRSISTFGVSVKETANPIGFFGTGLKYAIAVLLRTGHEVMIFSGESRIEFGTRRNTVRGQEFEFITMAIDGAEPNELGFTTELGKTWALWMAYRELACNCRDEEGDGRFDWAAPDPEAGKTKIIVKGQEFEAVFANRHEYLLEDEPQFMLDSIQVRTRPGSHYFYRDVRVMPLAKTALFTYNDTTKLDLTEDRTVEHQWEPMHRIALAYLRCNNEKLLRDVLTANESVLEAHLDFHGFGIKPSDTFLQVVSDLSSDRLTKINPTALKVWMDATNKCVAPKEIELTSVQEKSLEKALDFCKSIGFMIRGSYPIKVVETLGENTLGLAQDQTIFIAERTFQLGGTKQVAATLIEEYIHLRHNYLDCTREMQNYLFEKLVSVGEELVGEPL